MVRLREIDLFTLTRIPQILGLGLYMTNRKLLASVFAEGAIATPEEQYVRSALFLAGLLVIAVINVVVNWVPTRRWVILAGVVNAAGMVVLAVPGHFFFIGSIMSGFSFSILTMYFALVVCRSTEKEHLLSLAVAVLLSVVFVGAAQVFRFTQYPAIFIVLPIVIGFLLASGGRQSYSDQEYSLDRRERISTAFITLSAISVGYIMCSFLNGLATDHFVVSSPTMLATFTTAGLVVIVVLAILSRAKIETRAMSLVKLWPLFFVLLIFGLICFSAAFLPETNLAMGIAFSSLTLFYFCAWIICPLIIRWAGMPIISTYGVVSIACDGFFWRQLGEHVAGTSFTVVSVSFFGSITVLFVLLCMVLFLSRRMQRLSMLLEKTNDVSSNFSYDAKSKLKKLGEQRGFSDRESEVVGLMLLGYSASKIAGKLFISESTVRFHLKNVYRKCDVHSKQELLDMVNEDIKDFDNATVRTDAA